MKTTVEQLRKMIQEVLENEQEPPVGTMAWVKHGWKQTTSAEKLAGRVLSKYIANTSKPEAVVDLFPEPNTPKASEEINDMDAYDVSRCVQTSDELKKLVNDFVEL